jgi:arabinogalactan endo-1,4-beta-galactosidase
LESRHGLFTGRGWFANRAAAAEFIAGADMSHLAYFESRGVVCREDGVARDALHTLTDRRLN